jgi:hypothetical protein
MIKNFLVLITGRRGGSFGNAFVPLNLKNTTQDV